MPVIAAEMSVPKITYDRRGYWSEFYREREFYSSFDRWNGVKWDGGGEGNHFGSYDADEHVRGANR